SRDFAPPHDEVGFARIKSHFAPPAYEKLEDQAPDASQPAEFHTWYQRNTRAHKMPGYRAVMLSLKSPQRPPGDITADELDAVAELAERFSFGMVRSTHDQNLVLTDVRQSDLPAVWRELAGLDMATPNIGTLTDMICCPGLDFCSLANATSIPIARQINERFDDLDYL